MMNKITNNQRHAASTYWVQILTREVSSSALKSSQRNLPPFIAVVTAQQAKLHLETLSKETPLWPLIFKNTLDSLLTDANNDLCLTLQHGPQGLLKKAAEIAGVPNGAFPAGILNMRFDNEGNIILENEKINAQAFLNHAATSSVDTLNAYFSALNI